MKCDAKISVIVPVYNLEACIERCVRSILAQTHQNLEIILVDDGSSDGSLKVMKELEAADARVIAMHKENGGVTSARLKGMEAAAGDYIGFVDGDDEIDPDMYETLLGNLLTAEAEVSHCGQRMLYDNGKVNYYHNTGIKKEQTGSEAILELLTGELIEPGLCTKLFSKRVADDFLNDGIMDCSIRVNEDLLMNYYLFAKAERIVFEDVCKYRYYAKANIKLNSYKIFDPIRVKEIIYASCCDELKNAAEEAIVRTCVYTYAAIVVEGGYTEERKKIRETIRQHPEAVRRLPKRQKVLAKLIMVSPGAFSVLYKVYSEYFQDKKYE